MSAFEHDEMSRLIHYKYFANFANKTVSAPKKKVASYLIKKTETDQPILDLPTAIAQKQDPKQIKDSYDPMYVEKYWYAWWEKNRYFNVDSKNGINLPEDKKFIIVVPVSINISKS